MLTWEGILHLAEDEALYSEDNTDSAENLYQTNLLMLYDCWINHMHLTLSEFYKVFAHALQAHSFLS